MSAVAPDDKGTLEVSRKLVVDRTCASCLALLVLGVFQGGLSFAVAPFFWVRAEAAEALALLDAIADGLAASWDW